MNFVCEKCGKKFNSLYNLTRHKNKLLLCTNTLICSMCKKKFSNKYNLERHLHSSCIIKQNFENKINEQINTITTLQNKVDRYKNKINNLQNECNEKLKEIEVKRNEMELKCNEMELKCNEKLKEMELKHEKLVYQIMNDAQSTQKNIIEASKNAKTIIKNNCDNNNNNTVYNFAPFIPYSGEPFTYEELEEKIFCDSKGVYSIDKKIFDMIFSKDPSNIRCLDIARKKLAVYLNDEIKWGKISLHFLRSKIIGAIDNIYFDTVIEKIRTLREETSLYYDTDLKQADKELSCVKKLIHLQNLQAEHVFVSIKDRALRLQEHIKNTHKPIELKIKTNKEIDTIKFLNEKFKKDEKDDENKSNFWDPDKEECPFKLEGERLIREGLYISY
jgi:FtsZ-binding cell division protein ZapB